MTKALIALMILMSFKSLYAEVAFSQGALLEDSLKLPNGHVYSVASRTSQQTVTVNAGDVSYSYVQPTIQWELSKLVPENGAYHLDPSFGTNGIKVVWSGPYNSGSSTNWYRPKGLVYSGVGSESLYVFGFERVLRVDLNGQPVSSFGSNGVVPVGNLGSDIARIYQVAVDGQGRLVVALERLQRPFTWSAYDYSYAAIRRLLTDGSVDGSFAGTTIGHYVYQFFFAKLLVLADGNILVMGTTKDPNNQTPVTATLLSGSTGTYLPFWPASYTPNWWAYQSVVYTGKLGSLEAFWQNADGSIRTLHKLNGSVTRFVLGFKPNGLDSNFGTSGLKYVSAPTNYNWVFGTNVDSGLFVIHLSKTTANSFLLQRYYDTGKDLVVETPSYVRNWTSFGIKRALQVDDKNHLVIGNYSADYYATVSNVFTQIELPKLYAVQSYSFNIASGFSLPENKVAVGFGTTGTSGIWTLSGIARSEIVTGQETVAVGLCPANAVVTGLKGSAPVNVRCRALSAGYSLGPVTNKAFTWGYNVGATCDTGTVMVGAAVSGGVGTLYCAKVLP